MDRSGRAPLPHRPPAGNDYLTSFAELHDDISAPRGNAHPSMEFRPPFPAAQTYIHTPCNARNARVISGCNGYSGRNGWGRETCVTDGVAVAAPRRGFRACASHPQACRRHLQGACATGASSLRSAPLACFWLYTEALERGLLS